MTGEPARHSGWTAVPHGVWTLACSHQARTVLCWLWSHNDTYRERLSVAAAARLLGMQRRVMQRALAELEAGGLLVVAPPPRRGLSATIHLDVDAWNALGTRLPPVTMTSGHP